MAPPERYIAYIDNGGTFTDAVIIKPDGSFFRGKAATTPAKLEDCFFGSLRAAAGAMGKPLAEVIANADVIGYGTTLGTNVMVTGSGAPKIGFITNKGHEDRILIMRLRVAGLTDTECMHIVNADKPEPLVPRKLIRGVRERIDSQGEIIVPLDQEEVRKAIKELIDLKVEGIAVGLLWSFLNPTHERLIRDLIREIVPDMPVTLSSEVAPTVREYPRYISAIVDLYIGKPLKRLLSEIKEKLIEGGYKRPLLIMQAAGGLSRSEVVKPATTLHSGPVGGLAGVEFFKKLYGYKNAIGSDVGGTSFDISVSSERGPEFVREPVVGRWEIANPMREIITLGAGGGTQAWYDEVSHTLRVGPQSSGADPGPVCYDAGGTEPTVTDADVVMQRIDPNSFLGGQRKLNREKAITFIKEKIADPLNLDIYDTAEGICKIIDAKMQASLGTVLANKGIDPKEYVLFAFGGAGPAHCAAYSAGLGFSKVIIVPNAAVFSAFGASTEDVRHRYEASPFIRWPDLSYDVVTSCFNKLTSLNQIPSDTVDRFNTLLGELEKEALADMAAEGFQKTEIKTSYEMSARYGGQLWELRCIIPIGRITSVDDVNTIIEKFENDYHKEYGQIAMVPTGGLEIISLAIVCSAPTPKPIIARKPFVGPDPSAAQKNERDVYFDGKWVKTKIYDMTKLEVGNVIPGPAIIEAEDTTLVVPIDRVVTVDEYENMIMEEKRKF